METKFKHCILLMLIALITQTTSAQDFHLSQYDMAPLYINPALAGMYGGEKGKQGDFRMMANYRSQWQKLESKPFSTAAFAFDKPLGRFGVGAYIMDNLAGRSNYNTFNLIIGGSYAITPKESKDHYLTTGVQFGIINRKFGNNDLLFSSQYENGYGLDPAASNGENFQKVSILKFDSNFGIFYKYRNPFAVCNPFINLSIYHLNKPDQAVTGLSSKMPMRFNLNLGSDIYVNKDIDIKPSVFYMYQGKAQELNMGLLLYYRMYHTEYDIIAGAAYRWKDAITLHAGIKQAQSTFRVSYDIVTNPLKTYSGTRGAIELGVIYSGFKRKTAF